MAKMVKCKTCGQDIAKSAKICPNCGAKQKKHVVLGVILVLVGIVLIAAAFGGGEKQPQKVEDESQDKSNGTQASDNGPVIFGVGDSAELNGVVVTLVDVQESQGSGLVSPSEGNVFITCEFVIENNSNADVGVSSLLSFEAYIDDYAASISLSALTSSGKSQLDGAVAPGKKMSGVVGYEAPSDWKSIEIRFKSNVWSSSEYIFAYTKGAYTKGE